MIYFRLYFLSKDKNLNLYIEFNLFGLEKGVRFVILGNKNYLDGARLLGGIRNVTLKLISFLLIQIPLNKQLDNKYLDARF